MASVSPFENSLPRSQPSGTKIPNKESLLQTQRLLTVANQLTLSRLVLTVFFVAIISSGPWEWLGLEHMTWSLILFVIATSTDALDGYLARRWQQVSALGRILDPFVDKIIICGGFICLIPDPNSGLAAWMVTLIVARELLITVVRSFLEQHGADFSASWSGKIKMILQSVTVGYILFYLGPREYFTTFDDHTAKVVRDFLIWSTLISTGYSGWIYVRRGLGLFRQTD